MKPTPAKPRIIIAQVDGSRTAAVSASGGKTTDYWIAAREIATLKLEKRKGCGRIRQSEDVVWARRVYAIQKLQFDPRQQCALRPAERKFTWAEKCPGQTLRMQVKRKKKPPEGGYSIQT
jgi:hypothetical protein